MPTNRLHKERVMARPIAKKRLEDVLKAAGFTAKQREAAQAANEGREPEGSPPRGHGAPVPRTASRRGF